MMSDGNAWIEIVLLAMLAAFIGLRLVSVLGKRTGPESPSQRPLGDNFRPSAELSVPVRRDRGSPPRALGALPAGTPTAAVPALEAIAAADTGFAPEKFLSGARAAYAMVLEAFWAGDVAGLRGLVSDEVNENFAAALAARDGQALPNRLTGIDEATLHSAELVGQMAEVTVRFAARVATGDGTITTNDLWTFSRHVGSPDPAWVLIATDDEAAPGSAGDTAPNDD
jgi:predicted lipid-binding transport protein (Tim44 family)